jgi:hypothetical protein
LQPVRPICLARRQQENILERIPRRGKEKPSRRAVPKAPRTIEYLYTTSYQREHVAVARQRDFVPRCIP